MNFRIIMYQPYPNGMACSRRLHNYAKGILKEGGKVQFLIPRPTELSSDSHKNTDVKGTYEGIDFEYTCGTTKRANSFYKRRFLEIKGLLKTSKILIKDRKNIDAVIFCIPNLFVLHYTLLCKILGLLILREISEFPFFNQPANNTFKRVYQHLYKQHFFKLFDGLLVISHSLYNYLETRIRRKTKLLLVPIIVDTDEFLEAEKKTERLSIVLCGTLTQRKEGVLTLIRAFKRVSDKFNNLTLYLIGGTRGSKDELESQKLVKELCLEDKVVFTGYVSRERLKQLMCNASILALAKPSSLQADYCFPSKLGEYLATGNPVVVTDTVEISRYLENGVNAFIAEPDSVISVANKLDSVLSNPVLARKVGREGRKLAIESFDYRIQAGRITNFVKTLKSNRS